MSITLAAPAKINLHLGIYPGRDDRGYHRADSVMIALGLSDFVTVEELAPVALHTGTSQSANQPDSDQVELIMSHDVGVDYHQNTVWKAATRLLTALGVDSSRRFRITVQKNIPSQAGLGGSSSDAASTLLALCRILSVDEKNVDVVNVARSVGADVPFFLNPSPSLLTGAGDVLERTMPDLLDVPVVLVRPNVGVSTPAAYAEFDRDPIVPPSADAMVAALESGDVTAVAGTLYNNLEPASMALVPEVAQVKAWLSAQEGVLGAREGSPAVLMAGSGSCVFAICDTDADAQRIASLVKANSDAKDWWAISTKTVGINAHMC